MSRSSSSPPGSGEGENAAGALGPGTATATGIAASVSGTAAGPLSPDDSGRPLSGSGSSSSGLGGGHGVLFPPGVLVGGRYLVARFIARGGMGEVYEAEDVALRERIALKVVRSEVASDPRASERLKRELHLARRVSHPNVCRIYDLCFHDLPATGESLPVLTMELLEGETLGARLRRTGAPPLREVLAIARQIAGALDAAHEQGIVHRDLKADNIFLVAGRRAGELRVVVTDFGLARSGDGPAITQGSGRLIGSPAYMAPEQVEGGTIGPAADLYAFGVVLYELVTGERPFEGESVFEVAFKRLQRPPESPRRRRADLPPAWDAAILKLMERRPEARFETAHDAIVALERARLDAGAAGGTAAVTGMAVAARAGAPATTWGGRLLAVIRQRRVWVPLAAVLTLVALSRLSQRFGSHRKQHAVEAADEPAADHVKRRDPGGETPTRTAPPPLPDLPSRLRQSVAVLGFKNVSGRTDKAWLGTAFQQMVTSELGVGEQLRLVSDEAVARLRRSLAISEEPSLAPDTLKRIYEMLGSDYVVRGSYVAPDGGAKVHLDMVLQDARSGDTIARAGDDGVEGELSQLVTRVGAKLRAKLGVVVTPSEASTALASAVPAGDNARRLYSEGLNHLRRWEANAARVSLEAAVQADDRFPLAHAALAEAFIELGHEERARAEARRAFELSAHLPREQKLAVEGRYHSVMGEKDEAIAVYGKLFGLFPDDVEHGLELAIAEWHGQHEHEALATLEQLRRLPAPASDDPRIDLLEAHVEAALNSYDRARKMAQAAAVKARVRQERMFVAEARYVEARAAMMLGEPDAAQVALREARTLYQSAGDRKGIAVVHDLLGGVRVWVDDIAGAIAEVEEELKVARELGNRSLEWKVLNALAIDEMLRGDLVASKRRVQERRAVEASLQAAGEKWREQDRQRVDGLLYAVEGRLEASRKAWESLRVAYNENEMPSARAFADTQLGAVLIEQDELDTAIEKLREAETLATKVRDQRRLALARYYLAQAALAEGRIADAEEHARGAHETFSQMKAPAASTAAVLVQALALARLGRVPEALKAVTPRLEGLARIQPLEWRLIAQATAARVLAHAPERGGEAMRLAAGVVADARRASFLSMAIAGQLALGEVALRLGHTDRGRAALGALIAEAEPLGFDYAVRRAQELLGGQAVARHRRRPGSDRIDIDNQKSLEDLPEILGKVRRKLPDGLSKEVVRQFEEATRRESQRLHLEEKRLRLRPPSAPVASPPPTPPPAPPASPAAPAPPMPMGPLPELPPSGRPG